MDAPARSANCREECLCPQGHGEVGGSGARRCRRGHGLTAEVVASVNMVARNARGGCCFEQTTAAIVVSVDVPAQDTVGVTSLRMRPRGREGRRGGSGVRRRERGYATAAEVVASVDVTARGQPREMSRGMGGAGAAAADRPWYGCRRCRLPWTWPAGDRGAHRCR